MVEQHILTRLFVYAASGQCQDRTLTDLVRKFDSTQDKVEAKPQEFWDYLHAECDIVDWLDVTEALSDLCGKQLPRLFDERLESAKTVAQFEAVMAPYLELEHEYQEREDHRYGDTDDCA